MWLSYRTALPDDVSCKWENKPGHSCRKSRPIIRKALRRVFTPTYSTMVMGFMTLLRVTFVFAVWAGVWFRVCVTTLPPELSGTTEIEQLRAYFCTIRSKCISDNYMVGTLCYVICQDNPLYVCYEIGPGLNVTRPRVCEENQSQLCSFTDALVCRYSDGRGTCANNFIRPPFCICADADEIGPRTGCASVNGTSATTTIRTTQMARTTGVNDKLATTTIRTAMTFQPTTVDDATRATNGDREPTTVQPTTGSGVVNIPAIVAGPAAFLALLVLIGVVICRRKMPLALLKKQEKAGRNSTEEVTQEYAEPETNLHVQVHGQLVPDSLEYAYVSHDQQGRLLATLGTGEPHTYSNVNQDAGGNNARGRNQNPPASSKSNDSVQVVSDSGPEYAYADVSLARAPGNIQPGAPLLYINVKNPKHKNENGNDLKIEHEYFEMKK